MSKQVIVAKHASTGERKLFETVAEASEALGISSASISAACVDGRETKGWVMRRAERVFCVRTRVRKEWMVAVENGRGNGYIEMENPVRKIGLREIDRVKEITLCWYYNDGK